MACSSVCRDVPASMPVYEYSVYCYGSSFCLSFCLCMMSIVYVAMSCCGVGVIPLFRYIVITPFVMTLSFTMICRQRDLWRLLRRCLYTCLLSTSSSRTTLKGALISRMASHLDAFSAYPYQTRIPGGAPGGTTGKPEVCPTRSSRTSVSTTQDSCAHDR